MSGIDLQLFGLGGRIPLGQVFLQPGILRVHAERRHAGALSYGRVEGAVQTHLAEYMRGFAKEGEGTTFYDGYSGYIGRPDRQEVEIPVYDILSIDEDRLQIDREFLRQRGQKIDVQIDRFRTGPFPGDAGGCYPVSRTQIGPGIQRETEIRLLIYGASLFKLDIIRLMAFPIHQDADIDSGADALQEIEIPSRSGSGIIDENLPDDRYLGGYDLDEGDIPDGALLNKRYIRRIVVMVIGAYLHCIFSYVQAGYPVKAVFIRRCGSWADRYHGVFLDRAFIVQHIPGNLCFPDRASKYPPHLYVAIPERNIVLRTIFRQSRAEGRHSVVVRHNGGQGLRRLVFGLEIGPFNINGSVPHRDVPGAQGDGEVRRISCVHGNRCLRGDAEAY